jgi:hypothetical protein
MSYYGARYYEPKTSVWISVDPLAEKYPNESPYIYCGNSPVVFIDPDGEDRIYSASGHFIRDTGSGSKIIVMTKYGGRYLSGLDYSSRGTRIGVAKIIAHEAYLRGYKGWYGVQSMKDEDKGASTNKAKTVRFNTKQLSKGTYDDYHDLGTSLDHEANLEFGHKGEKIKSSGYKYLDHVKVYLGQALADDFKNVGIQMQNSTAVEFANRLFAAQRIEGVGAQENIDLINMFNSNNGSVTIDYNGYYGTVTLHNKGYEDVTVKLKIPETPKN